MKNDTKEIAIQETPHDMIRLAVQSGADLEKLEKLMVLQERWEANEARKAYQKAVSDFKKNPPRVTKDKQNVQYKSMYTTLGNLVNTVNPELSKHGLSASWEISQNGIITVTCVLTHQQGHSERTSASAPADTSGSKNAIQQIKSTITYLKAVTFESITGLASTDANLDDDGNGAVETITKKELNSILDMVADKGVEPDKLLAFLKLDDFENMPKAKYQQAMALLEKKVSK